MCRPHSRYRSHKRSASSRVGRKSSNCLLTSSEFRVGVASWNIAASSMIFEMLGKVGGQDLSVVVT